MHREPYILDTMNQNHQTESIRKQDQIPQSISICLDRCHMDMSLLPYSAMKGCEMITAPL